MSNRNKRKLENFDPNQSDPEDLDYGASPPPKPQRRSKKSGLPRPKKRQRYGDSDDDIEDDEEDSIEEDSFGDESEDEEDVDINPRTGRASRKVTKRAVKYEESSDEEGGIEQSVERDEDDDEDRDELGSSPEKSRGDKRRSLIVTLKLPSSSAGIMSSSAGARRSSRQTSRGLRGSSEGPSGPSGTRRSSRLSHDETEPLVELTHSGRHASVTREGTRSPEPSYARPTRGGKGMKKPPSAIMEASQETSSKEALASFESGMGPMAAEAEEEIADTQPEIEDEDDVEMGGDIVLQSEHEEDDDDDDMPIGSRRRSQRVRSASTLDKVVANIIMNSRSKIPKSKNKEAPEAPNEGAKVLKKAVTSNRGPRKRRRRTMMSLIQTKRKTIQVTAGRQGEAGGWHGAAHRKGAGTVAPRPTRTTMNWTERN